VPTTSIKIASLVALIAAACGISSRTAEDTNENGMPSGGTGSSGETAGAGVTSGTGDAGGIATDGGTGGVATDGGTGGVATDGGTGDAATEGGGAGDTGPGGAGGAEPVGGSGGSGMETGGTAGTTGATGGSGGTGPIGAYDPREGPFRMLIYSRTGPSSFRHGSIPDGIQMLRQIASEQGFEATATEENTDITAAGLEQYEIVFFMNTSGDVFNETEQTVFEAWITTKNGAFGGMHAATDTESGWAFYSELTGQYHSSHGPAGTTDVIEFDPALLDHPALVGLPNPWRHNDEWFIFDDHRQWSTKPGFRILGRKRSDNHPVTWVREWGNFRSFYTAIGHATAVFQDPDVKKHVTGGIMWAVRRDHLIR
jgi:type 1 glutamine amidotransferase